MSFVEDLLRECGIELTDEPDQKKPKKPIQAIRRGIPYTPQVFTPSEGGVPPDP